MIVNSKTITVETEGFSDIHDLTPKVRAIVQSTGVQNGILNVFAIGSTASVTTIEYEPALIEDMKDQLEQFASRTMKTRHSETWGDDNGFSHIRASFMSPGLTIPIAKGSIILGTWQQIVVIDHDNRPRTRRVFIQVLGE